MGYFVTKLSSTSLQYTQINKLGFELRLNMRFLLLGHFSLPLIECWFLSQTTFHRLVGCVFHTGTVGLQKQVISEPYVKKSYKFYEHKV